MKKFLSFCFMLFITACVSAPQDIFSTQLNLGEKIQLPINKVEVVNLQKRNEAFPYIEKKWPQSPVQIIQKWADEKIKVQPRYGAYLEIIIHQAEVVRSELPALHWYQNDEIKDTLSYQVEFVLKQNYRIIQKRMVSGKNFAQLPKKSSLADKETEWVKLANEMIKGLNQQGIEQLNNAF